jgi:ureidoacrylate peracid hydrolase
MATTAYEKQRTALLVVDPYNDFISEGGKIWPRIKAVAEANGCVAHMLRILNAARGAKLRIFYAMHHRYRPGDYESWKYIAPIQRAAWKNKSFEYGTWGGEIRAEFAPQPSEIVASEHWCSSGFANTDLDLQLKKHGIHQLIVIGFIAHTCIEATVRYAAELGYDVTVVKDATADYSDEMMHAALDINMPNYASAIASTEEIVAAIAAM